MIAVIGAGAFGTALALCFARSGHQVTLWGRNGQQMAEMQASRRLPGTTPAVQLPASLTATDRLADVQGASVILLALPTQSLRSFMAENGGLFDGIPLISCNKGLDLTTLGGPTALLRAACPASEVAALTGPSFAADIVKGLPTALTLACANDVMGASLQRLLAVPILRLYRNEDVVGCELGGALKNVIAIACGACIGQGLGESARAALMTRGFSEMQRLAARLGAQPETLMGLSGFGDLVLTCTSAQSRNFTFGHAMGQGLPHDLRATVEGVATARAAARLAQRLGLDLPIMGALSDVLDGTARLDEALHGLLSRPLKKE